MKAIFRYYSLYTYCIFILHLLY